MKPSFRNPLLRSFVLAASISLTLGQATHAATIQWDGAASANSGTAAIQTPTTLGANQSVPITLSANPKPLTATKLFVRVAADNHTPLLPS